MTATHDTCAHLLAAVLANPDEDTPRLVYADWLEEFGGDADRARAEFIRVQCELATMEPKSCERCGQKENDYAVYTPRCRGRWCRLKQREYYSSRRYIMWEWCGGVAGGWAHCVRSSGWARGFAHAVTCSGDDWCRHAGDVNVSGILAAHPVREMQLTAWPVWTPRLMRRTGFAPVYGFEVADEVLEVPLPEVPPDPGEFVLLALSRRWPTVTFRPPR